MKILILLLLQIPLSFSAEGKGNNCPIVKAKEDFYNICVVYRATIKEGNRKEAIANYDSGKTQKECKCIADNYKVETFAESQGDIVCGYSYDTVDLYLSWPSVKEDCLK